MHALAGVAESAGRLALDARRRGLREWTKHGNELVTSAEVLVHEHVTTEIARLCPGVAMLTEESTTHEIPKACFIVVDEIDGTAPFAAGADTWGVMLALVDEAPTCGVIHLPEKQGTITAQREQGCWINNRRVHMHFDGALRDALAGVDVSTRADDAGWRLIRNVAAGARALRSFSCAAASALELLEGVTQLYVNPAGGKIWDFAPIAVAIAEAGGTAGPTAHRCSGSQMASWRKWGAGREVLRSAETSRRHTGLVSACPCPRPGITAAGMLIRSCSAVAKGVIAVCPEISGGLLARPAADPLHGAATARPRRRRGHRCDRRQRDARIRAARSTRSRLRVVPCGSQY